MAHRLSTILAVACCAASTTLLASCTSIASKVDVSAATGDGIVYYMPLRPIKVTVSVDTDGKQTPSVAPGDPIPDLTRRFLLAYDENFVGKNHMNIVVSGRGLLTSSNAETTSGVTTIAQNFGKLAGQVHALGFFLAAKPPSRPPTQHCQPGETYSVLLFPENFTGDKENESTPICNFSVTIVPKGNSTATDTERLKTTGFQSGVFYRHDLPYIVTVTEAENNVSSEYLAFSPDLSEISFVPVSRTLFSDNKTSITLSDGVLTSVDQSSDGELVALSELPADVISAYFSAVGNIFTSLGSNAAAQKTLVSNEQDLAVAKIKKAVCDAAIAANSPAGKSGDEINKAWDNIRNACQ